MMTDRELLERAARGAGLHIHQWMRDADHKPVAILADGTAWQPLIENRVTDCMGDALRLAVRRRLNVNFEEWDGAEYACAAPSKPHQRQDEVMGDDENAAIRRAIVRAAALAAKEPT